MRKLNHSAIMITCFASGVKERVSISWIATGSRNESAVFTCGSTFRLFVNRLRD